jgi:hypothetical protein
MEALSATLFTLHDNQTWHSSTNTLEWVSGDLQYAFFHDTTWWADWSDPPTQLIIKVTASAADSAPRYIVIATNDGPACDYECQLVAGENTLVIPLAFPGVSAPYILGMYDAPTTAPSQNLLTTPGLVFSSFNFSKAAPVFPTPDDQAIPFNRFRLTLTDGTTSIDLPMTSLSSRRVSARPSYLQAVVPNAQAHIDQITPLAAGEFFITWEAVDPMTGAVVDSREVARANLETADPSDGPMSSSITLTGHKQKTYSSPVARVLMDIQLNQTSQTRIGFQPDINPADTVDSRTIDAVQLIAAAPSTCYMIITYV